MKNSLLLLATAASFAALPAHAATFVNVGDSATVSFDGTELGTAASLVLTLANEIEASAIFTFNYVLTNLSAAPSAGSRVTSFGFNDNQASIPVGSTSTSDTNGLTQIDTNGNNFPGIGNREICVGAAGGTCVSGPGGATVGNSATGSFTLDYTGSLSQLTLNDFVVRYQSTGANQQGSGTGIGTEVPAVPEPATWAMLLLGFGAIGYAMRRRKEQGGVATSRVGFAF